MEVENVPRARTPPPIAEPQIGHMNEEPAATLPRVHMLPPMLPPTLPPIARTHTPPPARALEKYPEPQSGDTYIANGAQTAREAMILAVGNSMEVQGKNVRVLKTYPPKIVNGKWMGSGLLRMVCPCGFSGLPMSNKYGGRCSFELLGQIKVAIGDVAVANPPIAIIKRYTPHGPGCTYDKSKIKPGQRKGCLSHKRRAKLLKSPLQRRPARQGDSLKELIHYRGTSVHAENYNSRTRTEAFIQAFGTLKYQYARFHSWAREAMIQDPDCIIVIEEFTPANAIQYYTTQVNALVDYTPANKIYEKNQKITNVDNNATYYHRCFVALGQAKRSQQHFLRFFSTDTAFCYSADQGGLMIMVGYHASLGWLMVSYAHVPAEDSANWIWFVQKNVEAFPHLFNATERQRSETVIAMDCKNCIRKAVMDHMHCVIRLCFKHMSEDVFKTCGKAARKIFEELYFVTDERAFGIKYNNIPVKLKELLAKYEKEWWHPLFFVGDTFGHHTNNLVESCNSTFSKKGKNAAYRGTRGLGVPTMMARIKQHSDDKWEEHRQLVEHAIRDGKVLHPHAERRYRNNERASLAMSVMYTAPDRNAMVYHPRGEVRHTFNVERGTCDCRDSLKPVACKHAIAFGRKKEGMTDNVIASTFCQSDILLSNVGQFYACIGQKPPPVNMETLAVRDSFKRPLAIRRGPGAPKKNRHKRMKFNDTTQYATNNNIYYV